jgi:hypothetical protein
MIPGAGGRNKHLLPEYGLAGADHSRILLERI